MFSDKNLIFIISQPRSGSTLLQSLIANSANIQTTSEPWLLLPFLSFLDRAHTDYNFDFNLAKKGIDEFLDRKKINLDQMLKNDILNIYAQYLDKGQKYFLDKTPRYYEITEKIIEFFPSSKIIFLIRNPLDVLYSIISTWTKLDISKLLSLKRDILYAPFIIKNSIEKYRHLPNILIVKYEDLIKTPDKELDKIFNFLQLEKPEKFETVNPKVTKGSMGDKKILNTSGVISDNKDKWLKADKEIQNFILAYKDYLGPEIFNFFQYEFIEKKVKSKKFDFFVKASKHHYEKIKKTPFLFFLKVKFHNKLKILT